MIYLISYARETFKIISEQFMKLATSKHHCYVVMLSEKCENVINNVLKIGEHKKWNENIQNWIENENQTLKKNKFQNKKEKIRRNCCSFSF